MSTYRELVDADRRLVTLRILEQAPAYECNSSVLQMALEEYGHSVSRDLLHNDLAWLAEQGLVVERGILTVKIATLTARGADVAKGRTTVPGVKKPGPGA